MALTQARHSILLIDDDPDLARGTALLLQEAGFQVHTAPNGADGVRSARQNPPDLIILDVLMPRQDGLTTFEQLASDERLKKVPVVMLTSVNDRTGFGLSAQDMETALGARPAAFLEKPCEPERLIQTIRKILAAK